jgi:CHAD domain-containing protein
VLEPASAGKIGEAIEMVVALQDHLGQLHDADVTPDALTRIPEGNRRPAPLA